MVKNKILPAIAEGVARANRNPDDIDLTAYVICNVSDDPDVAMRRARIHTGSYATYPDSGYIVDDEGIAADREAVLQGLMQGSVATLEHTTSDALVKKIAIVGTPEEAREQLAAYQEYIPHICFTHTLCALHTPYVPPLTTGECEDAYRNIISAFKK